MQHQIDVAQPGAVIDVPACTYHETILVTKPVTLDGHHQAVIDGDNTRIRWAWVMADDVTIRGFRMINAATPSQHGAIGTQAGIARVVIEDNDLGDTADGSPIAIGGTTDSQILNNDVHHGGQMGISTYQNRNLLIQGNHVHHNNTVGVDPYWAAGGIKAVQDAGLTISGNEVDHNDGPGIWIDILAVDVVISGNSVHDQTWTPIFFEVSSHGDIFGNTISASPAGPTMWGCIVSSSSTNVNIHDNACTDTTFLRAQLDDRPDRPSGAGTGNVLRNNRLLRPEPAQATSWWQWSPGGPLVPGQNGNVDQGNVILGSTPTPTVSPRLFGVNYSGAEFGQPFTSSRVLNRDYIYPDQSSRPFYFAGKGLRLVRLPISWELIQHDAFGPLTPADLAGIRAVLDAAQPAGQVVIVELHNYGRYYDVPLTVADSPKLADVWQRLATELGGHPALYGYELMNEPHDLPEGGPGWAALAQAATDGVRRADTAAVVLVPGYSWQTARFWPENNLTLDVRDPSNRLQYAAHQYFDADYSGTYNRAYDADGAYPTIGVDRVQPFLDWLNVRNARGMLSEYGVPGDDPRWLVVLDNFLAAITADPHITGGTYWSAGPWWGSYPLSVEPENGTDKPQMATLARYAR